MTIALNNKRIQTKSELRSGEMDLLIIGGGITGAGIALDAANRGMKTGLIDMQDFAAGTSSRSTKLVHGGLRYLKQFEVGLVAEVGKERAIVYENGPHVTTPEWMMLPFYQDGTFGPLSTNVGLRVYDFLAGVKRQERRKMLKPEVALEKEPLLQSDGLKGAGYYVEYKTDDARLTLEVMKKAVELGANALNYIKATDFLYDENGKVCGVMAEDQLETETFEIKAKQIINAAGPWVDEIREIDGSKQGKTLQLTKGVHLVFQKEVFPLQQAIYFDTPDKRMIFAIPRGDKTYVGTTDTTYESDIANPQVTVADRDYLLHAIREMFPSLNLTAAEVDASWAGVRPLISEEGKDPSEISRKDEIFISDSGLISMAGGKLTGYRKMAVEAVDKVVATLKAESGILFEPSSTMHLPMSGGDVGGSKGFIDYKEKQIVAGEGIGMTRKNAAQLVQQYGSNVEKVFDIYEESQHEATQEKIDPIVLATLKYALEHELAYTPLDYFVRRTGAMYFDVAWVKQHEEAVIDYMAKVLNWTEEEKATHRKQLDEVYEASTLKRL